MLRLADHWVWDSWLAADGGEHHLFFLRASRALLDPERRHDRASIGHATSRGPAPLGAAAGRARARGWAGVGRPGGLDRIGGARGRRPMADVLHGSKPRRAGADPAHRHGRLRRPDDVDAGGGRCWRPMPAGTRCSISTPGPSRRGATPAWSPIPMATAGTCSSPRACLTGTRGGRGVIGHARSRDLMAGRRAPARVAERLRAHRGPAGREHRRPTRSHVRVPARPHGRRAPRAPDRRRPLGRPGESLLGPWDLDNATALAHPSLYAANFVHDGSNGWSVLGFRDTEDGIFIGEISNRSRSNGTPAPSASLTQGRASLRRNSRTDRCQRHEAARSGAAEDSPCVSADTPRREP